MFSHENSFNRFEFVRMVINKKERRQRIIETVVTTYMETGEPVSSAVVAGECGLGLKPASIRSIMKELEDEGYLAQPHTSAGRVPTVKCYRFYVRYLMPEIDLRSTDMLVVRRAIEESLREHDIDLFMHHLASVLSELTDLIGVVLSPNFEQGIFDRIEIVNLGGSSVLLVLSLKSGVVNTIRITLDRVIPRWTLEETARIITERLHGLSVTEIRNSIDRYLGDVHGGDLTLVEIILGKSDRIFNFSDDRNVHIAGLSRVLSHPDIGPYDRSIKLADMFEHKNEIAEAFRLASLDTGDVAIHIGGRGPWGSVPPLSLIAAMYTSGTASGAVGIIGPARVHYPKLTALVKYAATLPSHFFSTS